jgi:hypothetical protein
MLNISVTVATVLTRAYESLTTRHLIYRPLLACQVTIQGYIYVAPPSVLLVLQL